MKLIDLYTQLCSITLIEQSFTLIKHTIMTKYSNGTVSLALNNQGAHITEVQISEVRKSEDPLYMEFCGL